jgi:hypothetical protein
MKICSVGAELFHANWQTDEGRIDRHDETNSRFPQFWERAYWHSYFSKFDKFQNN